MLRKPRSQPSEIDAERERAFEHLFDLHYERVTRVITRLVGDPQDAEDLVVEAFWRLRQRPFEQMENPAGWLFRVATRLGYNALRDRRRHAEYERRAGLDALQRQPAPDVEAAYEQRQRQAQARAALARMPLRQAQVLVLRYSGMAYHDIAAALGISTGSVGTLLARAEKAFERIYLEGDAEHASE